MELFPDIHLIDGVNSNAYLIIEPSGLTLVDSGLPGSETKILTYLRRIGKVPTQLSHILLTHQHVDHVGGAAELAALSGAEVIAHPLDAPAIEGAAPRDMPKGPMAIAFRVALLPRLRPVAVTRQVTAGETLPVLVDDGGLQVIATPGHTRGQIAFYLPGRRLLFAGDTYRHTMRGEVAIPFRMFNRDTAAARVSLASLGALAIDVSLPGHGKPILRDASGPVGRAVKAAGRSSAPANR